jgi:hypothetical protein
VLIFAPAQLGNHYVYSLVDLAQTGSKIVSEVGNLQTLLDVEPTANGSCLLFKFADERKFTDAGDYQVYRYCSGKPMQKIAEIKPARHYHEQFACLNASQILKLAESEGCLTANGQLQMTAECSYGERYCYMYRFIDAATNDLNYTQLRKACNDRAIHQLFANQT